MNIRDNPFFIKATGIIADRMLLVSPKSNREDLQHAAEMQVISWFASETGDRLYERLLDWATSEPRSGYVATPEKGPETFGLKKVDPPPDSVRNDWWNHIHPGHTAEVPREEPVTFSMALDWLKAGRRMARRGWNGKGMFIYLVKGSRFKVNRPPLSSIYPKGTEVEYHAHIDMKTARGPCVPWVASQTDLLAEDWLVVEHEGDR